MTQPLDLAVMGRVISDQLSLTDEAGTDSPWVLPVQPGMFPGSDLGSVEESFTVAAANGLEVEGSVGWSRRNRWSDQAPDCGRRSVPARRSSRPNFRLWSVSGTARLSVGVL